ncbi:MAG: [protein-PII] uridylyltransferase [Alphaproteobacteria bacterium]
MSEPLVAPSSAPAASATATADPDALGLREALAALPADARPLDTAKRRVAAAEAAIRARFEADGRAAEVVFKRCHVIDQLIQGLLDWAQSRRYPLHNPTPAERLAVVAVGGYGRGDLAPHSDIDLLFLLPYKATPRIEQLVETVLYTLWDLRLKVGHAVRSVDDALRTARGDTTVLTTALETRLLTGDAALYDQFKRRLGEEVLPGRGVGYLHEKLAERAERHEKVGDSRYLLEPNVKDGEGGLRDLHLIMWLARFFHDVRTLDDLAVHGMLDRTETRTFQRAQQFLWAVRCHLHYLTGRAEERLTFDLQTEVAARMGYKARHKLESVERFMKRFHLVAKDVSTLTAAVCDTVADENRRRPLFRLPQLGIGRHRVDEFIVHEGRIGLADPERFAKRPLDILRLLEIADARDLDIRPQALRAAKRDVRGLEATKRVDPAAMQRLVRLITEARRPARALAKLNDIGALGRLVPEFGRIVALMQHNLYHVYTVDEHTIRVIGELDAIAGGERARELPLCSEVVRHIVSRTELYLAAFFHDIGKGRRGNHAAVGEQIAQRVLERWQQPSERVETVCWLVRHHLLMTQTAFSRDLEDPKTIQDFVQMVQSPERLRLLLLLTVADIRAVSPTAWNGWKAQLLRALYRAAETAMLAGDVAQTRRRAVADAQAALRAALRDEPPAGWDGDAIERYIRRHDPRYWLGFPAADHTRHARLVAAVESSGALSGLNLAVDEPHDRTELTLYAPDHPGLFMEVAGALALSNASIVDAHIFTTSDSMALDCFGLQDAVEGGAVEDPRRLAKIRRNVEEAIAGRIHLDKALVGRRRIRARTGVFRVTPRVLVDNGVSRTHTVVELNARDRTGLLFDVTRVLKELGLVISSAHVTTFGERAVDVVYLKDVFGMKITSPAKVERLRRRLLEALETPLDGTEPR